MKDHATKTVAIGCLDRKVAIIHHTSHADLEVLSLFDLAGIPTTNGHTSLTTYIDEGLQVRCHHVGTHGHLPAANSNAGTTEIQQDA